MESIFVSLASYRDKKCIQTINSLYSNAQYPYRIFIGICQQNDYEISDEKCTDDAIMKQYSNNISIVNLDYKEAKGPTFARYICSTLYKNQDYFMQIDSHLLFVEHWDTKCINMINDLKTIKNIPLPVLSHYPHSDVEYNNDNKSVPHMCSSFFNDRGMISFNGAEAKDPLENNDFYDHPFIAAGFIFAGGSFIKDIPFDPHLDYVFVGEEILLSARAYTNGYDVFTPNQNIVYHYYTRPDDPKIWSDKTYDDSIGHDKILSILKLNNTTHHENDNYGLGNKRTLEQFYKYAGINKTLKTVNKNFCNGNGGSDNESNYFIFTCIFTCILILFIYLVLVLKRTFY